MTSAPQSVAARPEKRLVGNFGAKSAFFNVTVRDIPLESKTVNFAVPLAVASLLLRRPSASSIKCLSGSNSSS